MEREVFEGCDGTGIHGARGGWAKDARTLADEVLAMDDEAFHVAFKKSPIKRAKRSGLVRNAEVVRANLPRR